MSWILDFPFKPAAVEGGAGDPGGTSELDYIRTFLNAVCTTSTVKHWPDEAGKLAHINSTHRMLLYPPKILGVHATRVLKQYLIKISEASEANLQAVINNIQIGIVQCNQRETIESFTKPSTWCHCSFSSGGQATAEKRSGRFNQDIFMNVEWSTS